MCLFRKMKKEKLKQINIGTVTGAIGLRGEIKIYHKADDPDSLMSLNKLYIDSKSYEIEKIRYKKKIPVIKLSEINDRNEAESLVKKEIYTNSSEIPDLEEGNYFIKDLIGLKVISDDNNKEIGIIKDVISGSSQDLYEIKTGDGNLLLPAVTEFVRSVDIGEGIVKVLLPDGIEETKY